jgi:hypothetical protein
MSQLWQNINGRRYSTALRPRAVASMKVLVLELFGLLLLLSIDLIPLTPKVVGGLGHVALVVGFFSLVVLGWGLRQAMGYGRASALRKDWRVVQKEAVRAESVHQRERLRARHRVSSSADGERCVLQRRPDVGQRRGLRRTAAASRRIAWGRSSSGRRLAPESGSHVAPTPLADGRIHHVGHRSFILHRVRSRFGVGFSGHPLHMQHPVLRRRARSQKS